MPVTSGIMPIQAQNSADGRRTHHLRCGFGAADLVGPPGRLHEAADAVETLLPLKGARADSVQELQLLCYVIVVL
jgi:hypothetical protein